MSVNPKSILQSSCSTIDSSGVALVSSSVDKFLYWKINLNNILRIILWQQTWGVGFSEELMIKCAAGGNLPRGVGEIRDVIATAVAT